MKLNCKILVIDDDARSSALIADVLGRQGHDITVLSEPGLAIETARDLMPDLLFVNLLLPGTNGLKISKAVHEVAGLEKVPVIMLITHPGELDPKYTVTIGIPDVMVKPLRESEIIEKSAAVLGSAPALEDSSGMLSEITREEELSPVTMATEDEEPSRTTIEIESGLNDVALNTGSAEFVHEENKERDSDMQEKKNINGRNDDDERDLFRDEPDIFGEESKKARDDEKSDSFQNTIDDQRFNEEDADYYEEEKGTSPLKRILLIAASIVVGIALGVGAYMFFAAGNKQITSDKRAARTAPEPLPAPSAPVIPSEKPNVIPEIPVKTEPSKAEAPAKPEPVKPEPPKSEPKKAEPKKPEPRKAETPVQPKELKPKEPVKAVAEAPKKEPEPVKPQEKKESVQKKPVAKAAQAKARIKTKAKAARYFIQAGLFESKQNADAVAAKIRKKGYTPVIRKIVTAEKKTVYRVTTGNFPSYKKALAVSATLSKQGINTIVHKQ